ncbi:unnamed protein product [Calypogeia fissa]
MTVMASTVAGISCCSCSLSLVATSGWRRSTEGKSLICRRGDYCGSSALLKSSKNHKSKFKVESHFPHERRKRAWRLSIARAAAGSSGNGANATTDGGAAGDQVLRCISTAAEVSILTLVATDVVHEAQTRHRTSPTASAALGRALMGTLLLGAMKGPNETVQITFLGQGPLGQMTTVASGKNMVKGFVGNPLCQTPLKANGKLDVGSAVGTGILTVVRNNPTWKEPYSGTIPIYSGEVAEDIAHYLADSEQLNVALGLGVSFNRDTSVKFAGGFLVQVLPFCSDETLSTLETNILTMPSLSDSEGLTAQQITEYLLKDIGVGDYNDLPEPKFGPCTVEELKPRMVRAVASLGPSDVKNILAEQGHVEVKCEFCAEVVRFGEADLQEILQPN